MTMLAAHAPSTRPPRPAVAWLLTLLLAGLGHLYAGRPRRGAAFLLLDAAWAALSLFGVARFSSQGPNLYVPALFYWSFRFFAAADAARTARGAATRGRVLLRWIACVAALLLFGFAHLWTVFHSTVALYSLPTGAMAPTLVPGDVMLVDRLAYGVPLPLGDRDLLGYGQPERGHVIVYAVRGAGHAPKYFVFRVAGAPGDEVQIREGRLRVNGLPVPEPYLHADDPPPGDFGPVTVPEGCFFVLGDRRSRSRDSRSAEEPFVRRAQVVGRVRVVLFSSDRETREPRWDRCGAVVR